MQDREKKAMVGLGSSSAGKNTVKQHTDKSSKKCSQRER